MPRRGRTYPAMLKDNSLIQYEFSEHAYDMLRPRNIRETWVVLALEEPGNKEPKEDGTVHYIRAIEECGGKYLPVVVNPDTKPQTIVTAFFDRRLRRST